MDLFSEHPEDLRNSGLLDDKSRTTADCLRPLTRAARIYKPLRLGTRINSIIFRSTCHQKRGLVVAGNLLPLTTRDP